MTREEARKSAEVMLAYADGKTIEVTDTCCSTSWSETEKPLFNWASNLYRIKQEPKYRPYANAKEFSEDLAEKGGYVKQTNDAGVVSIWSVAFADKDGVMLGGGGDNEISYDDMITNDFTWLDGTPCGVKE